MIIVWNTNEYFYGYFYNFFNSKNFLCELKITKINSIIYI